MRDAATLNVAMLSPVAPAHGRGGVQDIVWSLARGLVERGHRVTLVTSEHPDGVGLENVDGVDVRYLPVEARTMALKGAGGAWMRLSRACVHELHRALPLDVIHSQSFCALHLVNELRGVPVVVSLHGTHVDELRTRAGLVRESLARTPREAPRYAALWLLMLARFLREGPRVRRAAGVIATSREQRAVLMRHYRVREERLHDVWNGIDTRVFAPAAADPVLRRELAGEAGVPLVLAVARLFQEKGIQHLLRAWPRVLDRLPDARLAIVGDGGYRATLEAQAASLGLARVRFIGTVPLEALPAMYAACDLFVNPTVRINGYDLTILQAMAAARAVVVSDIGSVPTAVADGIDGVLVPPTNSVALAAAIATLLQDPARRAALGEAARRTVMERFSVEALIAGTLAVYRAARAAVASVPPPPAPLRAEQA